MGTPSYHPFVDFPWPKPSSYWVPLWLSNPPCGWQVAVAPVPSEGPAPESASSGMLGAVERGPGAVPAFCWDFFSGCWFGTCPVFLQTLGRRILTDFHILRSWNHQAVLQCGMNEWVKPCWTNRRDLSVALNHMGYNKARLGINWLACKIMGKSIVEPKNRPQNNAKYLKHTNAHAFIDSLIDWWLTCNFWVANMFYVFNPSLRWRVIQKWDHQKAPEGTCFHTYIIYDSLITYIYIYAPNAD